jgi:hypothetical protein
MSHPKKTMQGEAWCHGRVSRERPPTFPKVACRARLTQPWHEACTADTAVARHRYAPGTTKTAARSTTVAQHQHDRLDLAEWWRDKIRDGEGGRCTRESAAAARRRPAEASKGVPEPVARAGRTAIPSPRARRRVERSERGEAPRIGNSSGRYRAVEDSAENPHLLSVPPSGHGHRMLRRRWPETAHPQATGPGTAPCHTASASSRRPVASC